MIAIIDYEAGNICSVQNALERLGAPYELTADAEKIRRADKVILPGVGNASQAMASLRSTGLDTLIPCLRQPVLGICVGLQLMCRNSEEGPVDCMGLLDARVRKFPETPEAKVPHMGWNSIGNLESKLFKDLSEGSYVYFVHSYYPELSPDTIATCRHGDVLLSAALRWENFYGTQFHPEKSGSVGAAILQNFLAL